MLLISLINMLIYAPVQFVITMLIIVLPLFMSITLHEWAHGYVAYQFGDPTPKLQGRLTLNPFAHLDPLGTLMLFTVGIGWAKPVMLNPLNYPDRTKQMLVALAGPMSNILLAVFFSVLLVLVQGTGEVSGNLKIVVESLGIIVRINLILAIFNLIPIPPLDGSRILAWMLPRELEYKFLLLEPYGILILLLLLFSGGLNIILTSVDFVEMKLLELIKLVMTGFGL